MTRKAEGGAAAVVAVLVVLVIAAFLVIVFTDWDLDGDSNIETVAFTDTDEPDVINVENPVREREVIREREIREVDREPDRTTVNVNVSSGTNAS